MHDQKELHLKFGLKSEKIANSWENKFSIDPVLGQACMAEMAARRLFDFWMCKRKQRSFFGSLIMHEQCSRRSRKYSVVHKNGTKVLHNSEETILLMTSLAPKLSNYSSHNYSINLRNNSISESYFRNRLLIRFSRNYRLIVLKKIDQYRFQKCQKNRFEWDLGLSQF